MPERLWLSVRAAAVWLLLGSGGALFVSGALRLQQVGFAAEQAVEVARMAQSITVAIDGAVQGSGVLVQREGNRYTVLTAWHVIGENRPGEEVAIATADGQSHQAETKAMRRLASDIDLGLITFAATNSYQVAALGESRDVSIGEKIYVAGFPLPTAAVPVRLLRFLNGDVQANARMAIPNGYQLLYSNPTLPGMSGGAVLNARGELIGIHGQGETANAATEQNGIFVKTGTNQAVPIAFFKEYRQSDALAAASVSLLPRSAPAEDPLPHVQKEQLHGQKSEKLVPTRMMRQSLPETADDYLAQARQLFSSRGNERLIIDLMRDSIALRPTALAYFYRAKARHDSGDVLGAMNDYNQALRINPAIGDKAVNRGRKTGESSQGKGVAMRLAMEQVPRGAAVIDKNCQDVLVGADNYMTRCTVTYTKDDVE